MFCNGHVGEAPRFTYGNIFGKAAIYKAVIIQIVDGRRHVNQEYLNSLCGILC